VEALCRTDVSGIAFRNRVIVFFRSPGATSGSLLRSSRQEKFARRELHELHGGYLIGQERILTNRSGLFGWGDDSDFEAHVFDRVGRETEEVKVPRVTRNGKAYAEVRIPEGYSVAIIRKVH